ncbi:pentapeptide repeat-containing protein [Thiotrichales bacterium 19S3-7]|nr:pentapeptide repeat-containing protein [Thiotrichales bacterium 19S3-7]MCF6801001.1 pentapeptide repeat-containing protein [Thiotrichales bacterium 19S3-11]
MKEYIGLTSWLESKFVERVIHQKLSSQLNTAVSVPSLDDASSIGFALTRYNHLLGEQDRIPEPTSRTGYRTVGQPGGRNWDDYDHFVIPINTGAAHNEAIILFPGTNKAIFIDPMGGSIPVDRRRELAELGFTNVLSTTQVQTDSYRCGDYTIAMVDKILSEENPKEIGQERLSAISREVKQLNSVQLNRQRASYIKSYVTALDEDPLITTDQREVVISESLNEQLELIDDEFHSVFLSTESDLSVANHDRDARFRDSLVYRQYLSGSLTKENTQQRLRDQGIDEDFIVAVEDPLTQLSFEVEFLFESSPIFDEDELGSSVDDESFKRQQEIAELEKRIQINSGKELDYTRLVYDPKTLEDKSFWQIEDPFSNNCFLRQTLLFGQEKHLTEIHTLIEELNRPIDESSALALGEDEGETLKAFKELARVFPEIAPQLGKSVLVDELNRLAQIINTDQELEENDLKKIKAVITNDNFTNLVLTISSLQVVNEQVAGVEREIRKQLMSTSEYVDYQSARERLLNEKVQTSSKLYDLKHELFDIFGRALDVSATPIERDEILPMLQEFIKLEKRIGVYTEDSVNLKSQKEQSEALSSLIAEAKEFIKAYDSDQNLKKLRDQSQVKLQQYVELKEQRLGLGAKFQLIHGLINDADKAYSVKEPIKAREKFSDWDQYILDVYTDGLENLTIEALAQAMFKIYEKIIQAKVLSSDSERLLLRQLSSIGIDKRLLQSKELLSAHIRDMDITRHRNYGKAAELATAYFDHRIEKEKTQYLADNRLYQNSQRRLLDLEEGNQKKLNQIKKIMLPGGDISEKLSDYEGIKSTLKSVNKSILKLDQANEGSLDSYAKKNLELTKLALKEDKERLIILAKADYKERIKPLVSPDVTELPNIPFKIDELKNQLLALAGLTDEHVVGSSKLLFNKRKDELMDLSEKFDSLKYEIGESYKRCEQHIESDNESFYTNYKVLTEQVKQASEELISCQREVTQLVAWLTTQGVAEIRVPDSIELNFSGIDLRNVDLSKIKKANGDAYDFREVEFDNATLGSISKEELQHHFIAFTKTVGQPPIDLGALCRKFEIETEEAALKFVMQQYVEHFPFLPILDQTSMDEMVTNLDLIETKLKHNEGFATRFAENMTYVNFSTANFIGKIGHSGVSLRRSRMPKNLAGVDLSACNLEGTVFRGSMIDSTTQLNQYANNLKSAIVKPVKGSYINLRSHVFDGHLNDGLPKDLRGVDLTGTTISNLDLRGYIIDETTILDGVNFRNVKFDHCRINNAKFRNCMFGDNSSIKSDISGGEFTSCTFDGVEFGDANTHEIFNISATFLDCEFAGMTNFWDGCNFRDAHFNHVKLRDLYIGEIIAPTTGKAIQIDKLIGRELDITGEQSVWKNPQLTTIKSLTAEQFITQLSVYLNQLKQAKKSSSSIRKSVHAWVRQVASNIDSIDDCNQILWQFDQWKNESSGDVLKDKENPKWRLFNRYAEGSFFGRNKGKVSDSSVGAEICGLINQRLMYFDTHQRVKEMSDRFLPEDQYISKIMHQLLEGVDEEEIKKIGFKEIEIAFIQDIRQGVATFDRKGVERYKHLQESNEAYSDLDLKAMSEFIRGDLTDSLAEKNKYLLTIKMLKKVMVHFPERIDQVMGNLSPIELIHLSDALIVLDREGIGKRIVDSPSSQKLLREQVLTENLFAEFLRDSIEKALTKMNLEEQRYFLSKFLKTPLTNQDILTEEDIRVYFEEGLDSRELTTVIINKLPSINKLDVINELLLNFNNEYRFHKVSDEERHNQVKAKFIKYFDMNRFKKSRFNDVVDYIMKNYKLEKDQATQKAQRLFKQLGVTSHPPSVKWPAALEQTFEGCESYDQISEMITDWAKDKAEASQINAFVKQVIFDAVHRYHKAVGYDQKKVNERLAGIAEISSDSKKTTVTIMVKPSEGGQYTLEDLNGILAKLKDTRGRSSKVNRSEKAFLAAIEEQSSTARGAFREISGRGELVITTEGQLKDGLTLKKGFLSKAPLIQPRIREAKMDERGPRYDSNRTKLRTLLYKLDVRQKRLDSRFMELHKNSKEVDRYRRNIERLRRPSGVIDEIIDFFEDASTKEDIITRNKRNIEIVKQSAARTYKRLLRDFDEIVDLLQQLHTLDSHIFIQDDYEFIAGCRESIESMPSDLTNIRVQSQKAVERIKTRLSEIRYDSGILDIRTPVRSTAPKKADKLFMKYDGATGTPPGRKVQLD